MQGKTGNNPLQQLTSGSLALICGDDNTLRSTDMICSELDLQTIHIESAPDGTIDLNSLQSTLYRDRHGDIKAVFVSASSGRCARDVLDQSWHDAELIIDTVTSGSVSTNTNPWADFSSQTTRGMS